MTPEVFHASKVTIDRKSVLRYLGCVSMQDEAFNRMIDDFCTQAEQEATFRVCYYTVPLKIQGDTVHLGDYPPLKSNKLAENLDGTTRALVFCASCGAYFDRKINAAKLRPSEAVLWDAVGTAAVEQLCDDFCDRMHTVRPRFSPGYGDLPLETQRDLLQWLSADKLLGIGLTDSLLMTPTKSVTAIAAQESL